VKRYRHVSRERRGDDPRQHASNTSSNDKPSMFG
jgi:hypothetical protein